MNLLRPMSARDSLFPRVATENSAANMTLEKPNALGSQAENLSESEIRVV